MNGFGNLGFGTKPGTSASGKSAYDIAIENGYSGNQSEWLLSLVGPAGANAYEIAVNNGFVGNQAAWLNSLIGEQGANGSSAYEIAVENGFLCATMARGSQQK